MGSGGEEPGHSAATPPPTTHGQKTSTHRAAAATVASRSNSSSISSSCGIRVAAAVARPAATSTRREPSREAVSHFGVSAAGGTTSDEGDDDDDRPWDEELCSGAPPGETAQSALRGIRWMSSTVGHVMQAYRGCSQDYKAIEPQVFLYGQAPPGSRIRVPTPPPPVNAYACADDKAVHERLVQKVLDMDQRIAEDSHSGGPGRYEVILLDEELSLMEYRVRPGIQRVVAMERIFDEFARRWAQP